MPQMEAVTDCVQGLSPSERSVVDLVVQGHSNSAIARARSVAVQTVANQVAAVFRKLKVRSRRELLALTLREGKARV
jgi:DNA-binding NarL/FixJ family response regulator